jgi:hypothetical protein
MLRARTKPRIFSTDGIDAHRGEERQGLKQGYHTFQKLTKELMDPPPGLFRYSNHMHL